MRLRTRKGYVPERFPLAVATADSVGAPAKVIQVVTKNEAERLVTQRKAERVVNGHGVLIGYKLRKEPEQKRPPQLVNGTAISLRQVLLIAGQAFEGGGSQTMGLTESQRMERAAKGLPWMDAVESAVVKLECWRATQ